MADGVFANISGIVRLFLSWWSEKYFAAAFMMILQEQKYLQEAKCLLTFRIWENQESKVRANPEHRPCAAVQLHQGIILPVALEEMGSLDFTFQHQVIWTLEDVSERDQTSAAGSTSCEKTETRRVEANVLLCTYFLPCVGAPHAIFTFTETSHSVKSCHTWVKRKDIVLKYDFSWSDRHWKY